MTVASRARLNSRLRFMDRPFSTSAADFFAFAVGTCTAFSYHFIGDIPIAEVILSPLLPILIMFRGRRTNRTGLKRILVLMLFWLIGQVVSDIYRGTARFDWMRGDAAIIFFAVDFVALAVLLGKNEQRKILFIAGMALGGILQTRYMPTKYSLEYPWKFGYSQGVMEIVLLVSTYFYRLRVYSLSAAVIVGIIALNLMLNYRSPVLALLITIVLVFPLIPERISRLTIIPRAGSTMRVVFLAALTVGAGVAAEGIIHLVTVKGLLSEDAQAKNEEQAQAGNLLLGGRPELIVGFRAAMDSPLIGHGSWPKDLTYVEMLNDLQVDYGEQSTLQDTEENGAGIIPVHSMMLAAWVWAGHTWCSFLGLHFRSVTQKYRPRFLHSTSSRTPVHVDADQ